MADEKKLRDYLGRVIAELHETRQRLRTAESGEQEPVAVVAMSCRLPGGVSSPEDLWRLLEHGGDAVTGFPADRGWVPEHLAGRAHGGFLHDAARFDPAFFEINPREAVAMDPQQRLALEIAWEAVERAGIDPHTLRGSRTGVFVGANGQGYDVSVGAAAAGSEGYVMTGSATSVVSGRIAYTLGLEGPAVTVDTACSSSLTALHVAGHALRAGDCTHALVGGVTVMPHPTMFHEFDRQGGLASDGRCKAFSSAADGMGMAEGAAMVLVTTLSRALAENLPVLAVIRGSAVNSDGGSNGLTAPNGPSQQRVITAALASARLSPEQVDAVEAHGTGTRLGDPIEAQALLAVYGGERDRPLWLGSLKSNIGHTQSAAGVASVIKSVLVLNNGVLPRTLHADEPTQHVDWSAGSIELLTTAQPLPAGDEPRRIGISSFGISGTNAHLILESAPERAERPVADAPPIVPVLVSARTEAALLAQTDRVAEAATPDTRLADLAHSLATTRAAFEHRAVLVASTVDEVRTGLADHKYLSGRAEPGLLAFLFTGQGSQRVGMGRELSAAFPVFAEVVDEISARLGGIPWDDQERLDQTRYAQAALFAFEVALFRLLESWGVTPDYLMGHSIGEIAAAQVAGVLSLDDACTLVSARGRLMAALPAGGAMLAAEVSEVDVPAGVDVAAVNGPGSVVVSGTVEEISALEERWRSAGCRVKRLAVSHAFHSKLMEPMLAEFATVAESLTYHQPAIRMLGEVTDPAYWVGQVRRTVRFADGVAKLREEGVTNFVELGPDAALSAHVEDAVPLQRRNRDEVRALMTGLGAAWVRGVDADWAAVVPGRAIPLPTYAFQRQRYWPAHAPAADVAAAGLTGADHPLLGAAVTLATGDGALLTGTLSTATQPWLAEHVILGSVLVPGTAFVELALRAGEFVGCPVVDELTLSAPLSLPAAGGVTVQIAVGAPDADGRRAVGIFSGAGADADGEWTRHADGVLSATTAAPTADFAAWPPAATALPVDDWYTAAALAGLDYGPAFQGLTAAWADGDTVYAEVSLPEDTPADRFGLHPALLDSALHAAGVGGLVTGGVRLPFAWTGVHLHAAGASALRVKITTDGPDAVTIAVADSAGTPVATVERLVLRPADPTVAQPGARPWLFTVDWVPAGPPGVTRTGVTLVEIPTASAATADAMVAATRSATHAALAAVQRAVADDTDLALITTGGPAADAVAGLVRAAQTEHPDRFTVVDTDGTLAPAAALANAEPHLRIRDGKVLVPRLARTSGGDEAPALNPDGTVLITGGTGALGAAVARHLVASHGVRHLVLASRGGAVAPGAAALADLADQATITVVAADVSDRDALAAVLAAIPAEHPLTGVVHAAGTVDDGIAETLTPERVDAVLAPKATAAAMLHELTATADLALFALFSSASATFGAAGQANYAAANGFLDGLARLRAEDGLPALSVGWGLWELASGITAHLDAADRARITQAGGALTTGDALALLDRALGAGQPHVVAMPIDVDLLRARHDRDHDGEVPALLRGLVRPRVRRAGSAPVPTGLGARIATLADDEQLRVLVELVRTEAATVLGHPSADAVEPRRPFKELGFDSLTAVELRNRLAGSTGLRLPATLVFDYPNPEVLGTQLRERLLGVDRTARPATATTASDEPIAIIGMSCRYPGGVDSPEALWQLVASGTDAVSPLPVNRGWQIDGLYDPDPDSAGKSYVVEGGFVHDADEFDPAPFNISPREALAMDPQQRLMLEASWEALERAGLDPTGLRGSRTGVFAGLMYHDYATTMSVLPDGVEGFIGTGTSGSVLAGRVSYTFGFEGPAMTVDTACSSSLVTLHLAAQALRTGECDLAVAGGVTVLSTPAVFVEFSRQRALSPDGRCKAFAAAADGTGWAEGVGVVLVARLSDALRAGYPIMAVVRGTAVNSDGASNGLTAPNGPSQERVIRQALANAGLGTSDVDAVEAHGTGTTLGDPIEAQALLNTYGQDRAGDPLLLGSLKSNIGHSQAAAGVGGVIKMVMAMRNGVLPKTLHIDEPTPEVDWSAGAVELLTESQPWPVTGRPRRAGVSSFGVSGTNAHVVLEQAPDQDRVEPAGAARNGPVPWVLSATTADALRGQAARLAAHTAAHPGIDQHDVASALVRSRAALEHRAVVIADDRDGLAAGLAAVAEGRAGNGVLTGASRHGGVAFVFPGQGSQWEGMALELLESEPVFRARLAECELALAPLVDWSVVDVLRGRGPSLERVDVVQPTLWAVNVALAALWRSVGVRPSAVVGHSQGEIAAAVVAGGLSLADGARVVALRSGLLAEHLAGKGGMVSLPVSAVDAARLIGPWETELSLAGLSGPLSTVVSGDIDAVDALMAECERRGVRAKRVPTDCAGHSRQTYQVRERLLDVLAGLAPRTGEIPFYSAVTGALLDTAALDASYWFRNLREPVLFEHATRNLIADGRTVFVEVSAHPVLTAPLQETLDAVDAAGAVLGTLRRADGGRDRWLAAVADAHVHGVALDWTTVLPEGRPVELPTYAFQRTRFWPERGHFVSDVTGVGLGATAHPLLGAALPVAGSDGVLLTGRLAAGAQTWLTEHALRGTNLLPGTAFVEMALLAGAQVGCARLEELTLQAPLAVPERDAVRLQVSVGTAEAGGGRPVTVFSRPESADTDAPWTAHAVGHLVPAGPVASLSLAQWPPAGAEPVPLDGFYAGAAAAGYAYGPTFRGLRGVWKAEDGAVYAEVALPEQAHADARWFGVHPALLDAALHAVEVGGMVAGSGAVRLPFAWRGVALHAVGATGLRVRLSRADGADAVRLDIADPAGAPVLTAESMVTRAVSPEDLRTATGPGDALFQIDWTAPAASAASAPGTAPASWSVVGDDSLGIAEQLAGRVQDVDWHTDLDALALAVDAGRAVPDVVVWSGDTPGGDLPAATRTLLADALTVLQLWLEDPLLVDATLVVLTRNAVAADPADGVADLAAAAVRGLVRTAQSENPDRIVLIDVDDAETAAPAVVEAVGLGEEQVAVRGGSLLVPRLARARGSAALPELAGPVLVTGGTGMIGGVVARHLAAEHGVRELILLSRGGPAAPGATDLVAELAGLGATAEVLACDTGDRAALAAAIGDRVLAGVVHAAGALDDAVIGSMLPEQFDTVLRPKVDAAVHLHELTMDMPLRLFAMFSSAAAAMGSVGQGNYAAANAFLDALAQRRRAAGLPGTAIGWGMWQRVSAMSAHLDAADLARATRAGAALSDEDGAALFEAALRADSGHLVATRLDIAALRAGAGTGPVPGLLRGLVRAPVWRTAGSGGDAGPDLVTRLGGLSELEQRRLLLDLVLGHAAAVLGHASPAAVDPGRGFTELGFSSLTAIEIRNRLAAATRLRLPSTLIFDHPTAAKLAEHLRTALAVAAVTGVPPLTAELDRLEAALTLTEAGDETRTRVVDRMHALIARYDSSVDSYADLGLATDEQMFALIDGGSDGE